MWSFAFTYRSYFDTTDDAYTCHSLILSLLFLIQDFRDNSHNFDERNIPCLINDQPIQSTESLYFQVKWVAIGIVRSLFWFFLGFNYFLFVLFQKECDCCEGRLMLVQSISSNILEVGIFNNHASLCNCGRDRQWVTTYFVSFCFLTPH